MGDTMTNTTSNTRIVPGCLYSLNNIQVGKVVHVDLEGLPTGNYLVEHAGTAQLDTAADRAAVGRRCIRGAILLGPDGLKRLIGLVSGRGSTLVQALPVGTPFRMWKEAWPKG